MHEHGIAQEMVTLALRNAEAQHAERITKMNIEMCKNADESAESLRMYLETLTRGTLAEGAEFEIEPVSAPATCLDCRTRFEQEYPGEPCPECHSTHVERAQHDEFRLTSIEVDGGE